MTMTDVNVFVRIFCCLVLFTLSGLDVFAQAGASTAPVSPVTPLATPEVSAVATETPTTEAETSESEKGESEEDEADEDVLPKKPKPKKPRRDLPLRARLPKGVFGAEEEESPDAKNTLLGGSVPALWELERSTPALDDENLPSLLDRDTMAPPVPGKVLRYAARLMQQYDTDADGVLQEDEWKKMPGTPQAIDLDGDRTITLEELIRFIGLYGRNRTIHRPHPVERYDRPRTVSSEFQWFKPILTPPPSAPPSPSSPGETQDSAGVKPAHDPAADLSEEAMKSDETVIDDATYEEIVAGRQIPAERKYHTAPEALRGVPVWFLIRDRDGDGQVSLLEFAPSLSPAALALFGRLDKNGDGFITPDEVRAPVTKSE